MLKALSQWHAAWSPSWGEPGFKSSIPTYCKEKKKVSRRDGCLRFGREVVKGGKLPTLKLETLKCFTLCLFCIFKFIQWKKKKKQKCFPWSMENNFNKEENAFLFLKNRKHFLQCCIINKHHNKLKKKKKSQW